MQCWTMTYETVVLVKDDGVVALISELLKVNFADIWGICEEKKGRDSG